jgi:hypothetical protein
VLDVDSQYEKRLDEIDRFIMSEKWLALLPGKQLLRRFLDTYTKLEPTDYLPTAVSTVLTNTISIPELNRLKAMMESAIGKTTCESAKNS